MGLSAEQAKRNTSLEPGNPAEPTGDILPLRGEAGIASTLRVVLPLLLAVFLLLRLWNFTHDVPPAAPLLGFPGHHSIYSWDGDVFSDEGFYANDAINWMQEGTFHVELEYNQFVNLPLMQFIKAGLFSILGVSLFAARLGSLLGAIGLVVAVYFLVRRYEDHWTSLLAAFLVAINHYVFAYSRYAVDEVPVAFWVTLTFALAVRVRGDHWWKFAILTALAFACALLTKTNAIFATPLVGAMVIIQELDIKRVLLKFALCSVVFLSAMGLWYVALVVPHMDDFRYFFTLNVGISSSDDIVQIWRVFERQVELLLMVDAIVPMVVIVMTPPLMILDPRYRRNPLVYLSFLWFLLYMLMYAYYGRFYPRFFPMTVPPLAIWTAASMRAALDIRGILRWLTYALVVVVACSALWQMHRDLSILAYGKNSYNEMAADILRRVEADPSGNRVIMGHTAPGVALRTSLTPRHDRYSPHNLGKRLEAFRPGWAISEGEFGILANDSYYAQRDWFERYYHIELVASYDILDNFRGHKMHLYKLIPREEPVIAPPIIRAQDLGIESVSEQRRRASAAATGEVAE